ncbi:MAG: histidine phosphatase family protein [Acutalibacteraceae bacterium]
MKSYQIHLIRHGAIAENLKGAYIGQSNPPLSHQGIEKLKEIMQEYEYPQNVTLFTSPLKRCVQTCEILYPDLTPARVDGFMECNFGDWEGKTAVELKDDPRFVSWLSSSDNNPPPNGESGADFTRRICKTFERFVNGLIKNGITDAAVISHGGVIMTLLAVYGLPQAKPFDWKMDNGFGFSLRITPSLWMRDRVAEVYSFTPLIKKS